MSSEPTIDIFPSSSSYQKMLLKMAKCTIFPPWFSFRGCKSYVSWVVFHPQENPKQPDLSFHCPNGVFIAFLTGSPSSKSLDPTMGRLASLIFVWPAFCVAAFSEASVSSLTLASLAFNWPGETNTVSRPETLREGGRISPEIPKDSTPWRFFL